MSSLILDRNSTGKRGGKRRALVCGACEKRVNGVCVAYAKAMVYLHPMCETGKRLAKNSYMREYMQKRRQEAK